MKALIQTGSSLSACGHAQAGGRVPVPLKSDFLSIEFPRDELLRRLVEIQYERNDIDFHRGTFRVRGDIVEIFPPYEDEQALRVEFFGDVIESMALIDPLRGKKISAIARTAVYPGSHYVSCLLYTSRCV